MSAQHPSRSWRGCAMCTPHKRRGAGRGAREPVAVLRMIGKRRRVTRGDLGTHAPEHHDVRVRGVTARSLWT